MAIWQVGGLRDRSEHYAERVSSGIPEPERLLGSRMRLDQRE
jgi:hypothetical protein